jgi:hypothetical protein
LDVRVEPKATGPDTAGAAVRVGAWVEAPVADDQTLVDPTLFVPVVLAVINLPASSGVWV